jgi:hypothetical protein
MAWDAGWADLYSRKCRHLLYGRDLARLPAIYSGWMTYLSAPYASQVKLPSGVIHEAVPGGGLIMLATDEPFTSNSPTHLAGAAAIARALVPLNERFAQS